MMILKWKWVTLASLMAILLLALDRVSGEELKITFPSQPKQSIGKLALSAQVDPVAFPNHGSATLEVEAESDHTDLLAEGEISYTVENATLRANVDFSRPEKDPLNFRLALRVKDKKGEEHVFRMKKNGTIDPLPAEGGGMRNLSPLPGAMTVDGGPREEPQDSPGKSSEEKSADALFKKDGGAQNPPPQQKSTDGTVKGEAKNSQEKSSEGQSADAKWKDGGAMSAWVVVGILGFIGGWWWRWRNEPQIIGVQLLQADRDIYEWMAVVQCSVRRRTTLHISWNVKEDESGNEPLKVSYRLDSNRPAWLRPGEPAEETINPLSVFRPLESRVTFFFSLPKSIQLPCRQNVYYEIFYERGRQLWRQDVSLVFSKLADASLQDRSLERQERKVNGSSSDLQALTAQINSLSSDLQALAVLPDKVVTLERLLGSQQERALLTAWHVASPRQPSQTPSYQLPVDMTREEATLLATVNQWWQERRSTRQVLRELLKKISLPARFYDIKNIDRNLTNITETAYAFKPSDDDGGWLWYQQPGEDEALVVPADPTFFVGNVMTLVQRMFEGFDTVPSQWRFGRAYRACRLRAVPDQPGKYKLVSRGYLLLEGFPAPPSLQLPPAYETLIAPQEPDRFRTDRLPVRQTADSSFPTLLKTHLQQIATAFDESRQGFLSLTDSLQDVSQRLKTVESWLSQMRSEAGKSGQAEQEGHKLFSNFESLRNEVKQLRERLDAFEQPSPVEGRRTGAEEIDRDLTETVSEQALTPQPQANGDATPGGKGKPTLPPQGEGKGGCRTALLKGASGKPKQNPLQDQESALQATNIGEEKPEHAEALNSPERKKSEEEKSRGLADATIPGVTGGVAGADDLMRQLPIGWQEAVEETYKTSNGQEGLEKEIAPDRYVKRLLDLEKAVRKLVDSSRSPFSVEIVHLSLGQDCFQAHRTKFEEEDSEQSIVCTECDLSNLLFQLLLLVKSERGDVAGVLLPLGGFSSSNFPQAYQMLLQDVPGGITRIAAVTRPAWLQKKVNEPGDWYTVTSKMQLKYPPEDLNKGR